MNDITPSWLVTMEKMAGTHEGLGDADNPIILGMATAIAKHFTDLTQYCAEYTHDSIPWCGLAVAYCMAVNGVEPVTKKDGAQYGFLWAPDWQYFGMAVTPRVGAVLVFPEHVSLYVGEDATHFHICGGNQSDAINVITYPKAKLIAARWPSDLGL